MAQQPAEKLERVEVTGSRIRQLDAETAQPVFQVTQEQIQKSGLVTVGDIVNAMTSAGSPDFSKGSVLTANSEQGGQYINLRNLGSQRLLVLVNGKRWSQSVSGYTDLSTVPSALIDRIDVLRDGASSTYGSDAIAGVVNIILKKSMQGGSLSVYAGQNQKGDGRTEDVSLSYGASGDKGSLMFGFTYSKQEPVWAKDREITAYSFGPDHPSAGYGTGPWGRICTISASGGCGGLNGSGPGQVLNHTGGPLGDGQGSASNVIGNYHPFSSANPNDLFNSTSQMMFQSPTELKSIFTKGTLEISPAVRLNSVAMYAQRSSWRQIAGYPLNSTTQRTFPVYIDKDSIFNPVPGTDLFFARRTIEVPRITTNLNRTLHIDANLEGDLTLGGLPWTWSAGVNHSSVSGSELSTGNLNLVNLKKALGPSFRNASGQAQCGTAASPIPLAECTPFNILGGPSASTPEALRYVMSTGQAVYGSTVRSLTADLSGELFRLPAGNLGLAVGLERREVSGFERPGQFEQSGYSTDLAGNSTEGRFNVKEAYAELNIPVLKGQPGAELLNLNLSSRFSDYSNFGETTNSKASFMWKPVKDLLVRGTYAQGFRAPTVGDSFGGGSQSYDSYLDPCDTAHGVASRDAAVRSNCLAAGVPANFRQRNQAGAFVSAGGAQSPTPFAAGAGNTTLTPESAATRTLGVVYGPAALPGLTASLDWYSVRITNRIAAISAGYVLTQCYSQAVQSFCASVKRDPITGQVVYLERGNANLGELKVSGLDLGLAYRLPVQPWGALQLRSETSLVRGHKVKSTATSRWADYVDEYPYYRVRSNISLDWKRGAWSATLGMRYYGSVKTSCWELDEGCNTPDGEWNGGIGYDRKGALVYNDLSIGYKTPWKGEFLVGANNVFNRKPRVVYDASSSFNGNSSSSSVDPDLPIDRFFWLRYTQSF